MPICFVIQPFDAGKFDKRFDDVYKPAIEAAGLQPYRVDRDPAVEVAIDAIEDGIRSATICLADITTDNPNVWYELGFAFAAGRPVVMVCSHERPDKKYPFDIQHRAIIPYVADAPSDFETLKQSLTDRMKALLTKREALRQIAETEQVSTINGLSQPELYVLAEVCSAIYMPESGVPVYSVKNAVERAGLTALGFSLGIRRLVKRGFITISMDTNVNDDEVQAIYLTEDAWAWIEANEDMFKVHKRKATPPAVSDTITDDDVPF
jgi:nucleoside 2-deoxyribosyltransferase